jgi:hypothetical protein
LRRLCRQEKLDSDGVDARYQRKDGAIVVIDDVTGHKHAEVRPCARRQCFLYETTESKSLASAKLSVGGEIERAVTSPRV